MENLNYFSSNLKKLASMHSQRKIAESTNVSPASITNYINKSSEPSIFFLMQLKNAYGINIDNFLFQEMDTIENRAEDLTEKRFTGNYIIYYYDTGAYKGMISNFAKNTLSYGVISVFHEFETGYNSGLKVKGVFMLNRKEAEHMLKTVNKLKKAKEISEFYDKEQGKYDGNIDLSSEHIFLKMKNRSSNDHCFIILNNPPTDKEYIGGLGTVNSVSKGREHMPCIQYALLSKNILNIPDGEIYNMLALNVPNINVHVESEQLITLFKNLYINSTDFAFKLNDYQKQRIVEDSLTGMLSDLVEANLFRFAKISDMEDDRYFRIIVEEDKNDE